MKDGRVGAVINISSNALFLKIGESKAGKIKTLEALEYPLSLGKDTFSEGAVSREKIDRTCKTLKGFKKLIREYKTSVTKVVATTAVREASNRDYLLDQITSKTMFKTRILDDSEEKGLIYAEMISQMSGYPSLEKGKALIAYIGTGSLGVAWYKKGRLYLAQNIKLGSLKLTELLGELQSKTNRFHQVVDEFLSSFRELIPKSSPFSKIDHFVVCGQEIEIIASLCGTQIGETIVKIPISKLDSLYDDIKMKTPAEVEQALGIGEDIAEILLPSLGIYRLLAGFTKSEFVYASGVTLQDTLLKEVLMIKEMKKRRDSFREDIVLCAKTIGKRFSFDEAHANRVMRTALIIFQKVRNQSSLDDHDALLLKVASILHDIGKYVNFTEHYRHSFELIKGSTLPGISQRDLETIAYISLYHSKITPLDSNEEYRALDTEQRVKISKLAGILRLADALDRGHTDKIDTLKIRIKDNELQITIYSSEDLLLEEWALKNKSDLFEQAFGLNVTLKKKVKIVEP
jgi:exopolyphosphatase/guanosine-5'-triphosphate,3'-diphosphate pyrophosphatase